MGGEERATTMGTPSGDGGQSLPGAAGCQPATGDAGVDEAVSRLDDLADLPVAEHPAVFEYVHQRLGEALGELDAGDRAPTGHPRRGPGR